MTGFSNIYHQGYTSLTLPQPLNRKLLVRYIEKDSPRITQHFQNSSLHSTTEYWHTRRTQTHRQNLDTPHRYRTSGRKGFRTKPPPHFFFFFFFTPTFGLHAILPPKMDKWSAAGKSDVIVSIGNNCYTVPRKLYVVGNLCYI